ncbi:phage holin [Vagococcus fluvialis]|uniref:phage holin n=1 Tax=Vagococcus fluvialis TaxID=2738 RepID=UPI003B22610A
MKNTTYDKLKWGAIIVIPAVATFVGTVGVATGWEKTDLAVTIITAVGVLLGSVLGVSNQKHKKD